MVKFTVSGKVKIDGWRTFVKEIDAESENDARDKTFALFGSHNKLKRSTIIIDSVKKMVE